MGKIKPNTFNLKSCEITERSLCDLSRHILHHNTDEGDRRKTILENIHFQLLIWVSAHRQVTLTKTIKEIFVLFLITTLPCLEARLSLRPIFEKDNRKYQNKRKKKKVIKSQKMNVGVRGRTIISCSCR